MVSDSSIRTPGELATSVSIDRRAFVRYSTEMEAFCVRGGEARLDLFWRVAKVFDISVTGCALILSLKFEPGTILTVELPGPKEARLLQVRVIHSKGHGKGSWITGCAFVNPLSDVELQALLS